MMKVTVFGTIFLLMVGMGIDTWFNEFLINSHFIKHQEEFWLILLLTVIALLLPVLLLMDQGGDKYAKDRADRKEILAGHLFKFAFISVSLVASSYIAQTVFFI